jgi:methylase of polypeptide subunit release factors
VSAGEWAGMASEVRAEPRRALVAGPASDGTPGLADVEALLEECLVWLGRPGSAVMELAPHQAEPAARLARGVGYDEVRVEPDLAGRPRALVVRAGG